MMLGSVHWLPFTGLANEVLDELDRTTTKNFYIRPELFFCAIGMQEIHVDDNAIINFQIARARSKSVVDEPSIGNNNNVLEP
jgi:hypothetical protein